MTGREIVTLQLGHYSNFVGAHWWNIQDSSFVYDPKALQTFHREINHDVLFREGQTSKGDVTFTPRLVSLDLKGSLNSLRKDGTLYRDDKEEDVKWSGDVTLHKSDSGPKNQFLQDLDKAESSQDANGGKTDGGRGDRCGIAEQEQLAGQGDGNSTEPVVFGKPYYNLDDQVRVWSDYLKVHLHPRSIQIVQDFMMDSEDQPFNIFGLGQRALSGDVWEQWEDRVRFFTEECDLMQGFHVLFDSHNGFGGAAHKVLSYLKDEFPGKAIFTVPLTPTVLPDQTVLQRATRILNSALCVGNCTADSSLYLPLSLASSLWKNLGAPRTFPHLSYKCDLAYHSSAILAASLDTVTLPYRQESGAFCLSDVIGALSHLGRKVASLNSSLPFPMGEGNTLVESLTSEGREEERFVWHSLTPQVSALPSPTVQSCVLRGVPNDRIKRSGSSPRSLSSCSSVQDVLGMYLSETFPRTMNAGCVLRDPVKVTPPFPHIFRPNVTQTGFLGTSRRPAASGVESAPVMTSLQSGPGVGRYASTLHEAAAKFNIHRHHHFMEAGLEEEEWGETLDELRSLADCYRTVLE